MLVYRIMLHNWNYFKAKNSLLLDDWIDFHKNKIIYEDSEVSVQNHVTQLE